MPFPERDGCRPPGVVGLSLALPLVVARVRGHGGPQNRVFVRFFSFLVETCVKVLSLYQECHNKEMTVFRTVRKDRFLDAGTASLPVVCRRACVGAGPAALRESQGGAEPGRAKVPGRGGGISQRELCRREVRSREEQGMGGTFGKGEKRLSQLFYFPLKMTVGSPWRAQLLVRMILDLGALGLTPTWGIEIT